MKTEFKTINLTLLIFVLIINIVDAQYVNENTKLIASDGETSDWFGHSVAISNEYAIVGASNVNNDTGAAYIFMLINENWEEVQILSAPDGQNGDNFGRSVAIHNNRLIIGAPLDDDKGTSSGSAYVFHLINGVWTFASKLLPNTFIESTDYSFDFFGSSVSIHTNRVLVGAYGYEEENKSGCVYTFFGPHDLQDLDWVVQLDFITASDGALNDQFGSSVCIYNNDVMISAPFNDIGQYPGSVYIYEFILDYPDYIEQAIVSAENSEPHEVFGNSVSIHEDNAIIGTTTNSPSNFNTSAYIFEKDNSGIWSQTEKLNTINNENFGFNAVIEDEKAFILGKDNLSTALVLYVFEKNNDNWTEISKLIPSDIEQFDQFGTSISVSNNNIIAGNISADGQNTSSGAAYIFNCETTLPVEWLAPLRGNINDEYVQLNFSTVQEVNNSHFEIEQSYDGRSYRNVGRLDSKENSSVEIDYKYIHKNPSIGINYYRVKQVDNGGHYSYSNVISLVYEVDEVILYPNPVNETLILNSTKDDLLSLYNKLGQEVFSQTIFEGSNEIDMSELKSGIYLIRLGSGAVERIIKE